MFECCGCGRIFDEPIRFADHEEFWGMPCEREYWVSPCCHDCFDEIEESEDEEDAI